MSDATKLSVALFASMHALTCAEAQLHEKKEKTPKHALSRRWFTPCVSRMLRVRQR
jgi:hypothetical protein